MSDQLAAPDDVVSLTDFCRLKSAERKQVEMLAGFYHEERAAERYNDTVSNYALRLQQFAARPI